MHLKNNCNFQITCTNALTWLQAIPSASVDLIITDPPYESLEKHRAIGTTTRLKKSKSSSNEWFPVIPNSSFPDLLTEIYRVLANNSHFYLFCDTETMFVVKPIAEQIGFKFWKPIIWDKVTIGMGYHYPCRYECILFFEKGKRKLNDLSIPDVISCKRIRNGYPTEKPVSVIETLILQSTLQEELIADPFMGSGSCGIAALRNNRNFIGCDIKESAVKFAESRLSLTTAGMLEQAIELL